MSYVDGFEKLMDHLRVEDGYPLLDGAVAYNAGTYPPSDAGAITVEKMRDALAMFSYGRELPEPIFFPGAWKQDEVRPLRDGQPCSHPGCMAHISHPCEGCGRIGGREIVSKDGVHQSAVLSRDGLHRYRLSRWWGPGRRVAFLMLNPSTADANTDDATIRKCIGFAKRWGYDGIEVVNLFSLRSRDPKALFESKALLRGPEFEDHLHAVLRQCGDVVAAWGCESTLSARKGRLGGEIAPLISWVLREFPHTTLRTLGYTKGMTPRHPLMLAYATELENYQ